MANCNNTPAPTCEISCEDIVCRLNAADTNIDNLFGRTDDLNTKVDGFDERIQDVEDLVDGQNATIAGLAANLTAETEARIAGDATLVSSIAATNLLVSGLLEDQFVVVNTFGELQTAVAYGGLIFVKGTITVTSPVIITEDNTHLIGFQNENGTRGGLFRDHPDSHLGYDIIRVEAANVKIQNLRIFTDHPLTSYNDNAFPGPVGIRITDSTTIDCSGLEIIGCEIHNLANCILRQGSINSVPVQRLVIRDNFIHSFYSGGINWNYNTEGAFIDNNTIKGRLDKDVDTHPVHYNGIYLANNHNDTIISNNLIYGIGRHPIEYWNTVTDGNRNGKILNNTIWGNGWTASGTGVGTFGISAFGNGTLLVQGNYVKDGNGIGIEVWNDANNHAINRILDNHIEAVPSGTVSVGISLDGVTSAVVKGNTLKDMDSSADNPSFGIQIIHSGANINISDNEFIDAGNIMIFLNGNSAPTDDFTGISIENNVFRTTANVPTPSGQDVNAVRLGYFVDVVMRNNVSYIPTGASPQGAFILEAAGTVYTGGAADTPHVWAAGDEDIEGTNLIVEQ